MYSNVERKKPVFYEKKPANQVDLKKTRSGRKKPEMAPLFSFSSRERYFYKPRDCGYKVWHIPYHYCRVL